MSDFDTIIIGGGAAGLFTGACLSHHHKSLIIEHNKSVGKKILISGGGRCNFTNIHADHQQFYGKNPHFHKSALKRFLPYDFIDLVESHKIDYYEKTLGQLFCKNSAHDIVEMLKKECEKNNVEIRCQTGVKNISQNQSGLFELELEDGEILIAKKVVIATGGPALPSIGATSFGHSQAKKFGLRLVETAPALVPLILDQEQWPTGLLSGVSTNVDIWCDVGPVFREALLFTHKGVSGPAVLQASSFWRPGKKVYTNFFPGLNFDDLLEQQRRVNGAHQLSRFLKQYLPERLINLWLDLHSLNGSKKLADLTKKEITDLIMIFTQWEFVPLSTEGYRKAEVTRGGVSSEELSSKTMEAKKVPGLYFIGEVVDVTGWLGGYNFQWAWASAHACAQHITSVLSEEGRDA